MSGAATTVPAVGDAGAGSARVRQLVTVFAPEAGTVAPRLVADHPITIGRDPGEGGIVLPDAEASRRHARVEREDGGDRWRIVDLGSRNGLVVDGAVTREAWLADGSVIRVGGSLLIFVEVDVEAGVSLLGDGDELVGASVRMQAVRGEIARAAPRPLPVLVTGESGVGKELIARALHRLSGRAGPLVVVNCAAIAPAVAESELFGHVAGAFTGATARRDGLFAAADRGTLFLDEIGELPLELQPKLLRALAVGEVRPVGATTPAFVDVRVVAATLRHLDFAVADGSFRGDLLARLVGWTITVPPLRARKDDILAIAVAWLAVHHRGVRLSPGAAEALLLHGWPYNVRELEHVLGVAAARTADQVIRAEHLSPAIGAPVLRRSGPRPVAAAPIELTVDRTSIPSREDLIKVLTHHRGSVPLTADFFGRDRRQVYRWLDKHQLDPATFRA